MQSLSARSRPSRAAFSRTWRDSVSCVITSAASGLQHLKTLRMGFECWTAPLGIAFPVLYGTGRLIFRPSLISPISFDAFNANIIHLDELELYRDAVPYGRLKDATKAYSNKLILATTTAGDNGTGFCAQRLNYCSKIVRGEITGADADRIFAFIARADPEDDTGEVDYLSPVCWQQANPNWGITIRPEAMEASAMQAKNDPQMRKEFMTRSLNVFVSSFKAWFNLDEFIRSDRRYDWTPDQLRKLCPAWYGGADPFQAARPDIRPVLSARFLHSRRRRAIGLRPRMSSLSSLMPGSPSLLQRKRPTRTISHSSAGLTMASSICQMSPLWIPASQSSSS